MLLSECLCVGAQGPHDIVGKSLYVRSHYENNRDLNRDSKTGFFLSCPHRPKNCVANNREPIAFSSVVSLRMWHLLTKVNKPSASPPGSTLLAGSSRRPQCIMGLKKPVRFERSVPTHIASQIIAIIWKSLTPSGVRIAIQIPLIIAFIVSTHEKKVESESRFKSRSK